MQSISGNCVKFILYTFNFLILLLGIGGIAFGAYGIHKFNGAKNETIVVSKDDVEVIKAGNLHQAFIALTCMGVFTFVVAFMGCCGAATENACLLISYSVIQTILMSAKIGIAVWVLVKTTKWAENLEKEGKFTYDEAKTGYRAIAYILLVLAAIELLANCGACYITSKSDRFRNDHV